MCKQPSNQRGEGAGQKKFIAIYETILFDLFYVGEEAIVIFVLDLALKV